MKMQAAHERDETLDIDIGVLIFPTDEDPHYGGHDENWRARSLPITSRSICRYML